MHVKFLISVLIVMLVLPLAAGAQTLRVAAASNLETVLTKALIPAFQKETGVTVVPTFGSTKLLAAQLENGAPVDVFMAADTATVDKLAAKGLVLPETEAVYAVGRLVVWTRRDSARHPKRLQDLADPAYAKIAIANPALAPYGLAAQQSFAKAGMTALIAPRLVQAENISQALQYAQSGNADAALTALSLVIEDKDNPYLIVPDKLHAPIMQSLALVKGSANPTLAHQFVAFLTGKSAKSLWARYGYEHPRK